MDTAPTTPTIELFDKFGKFVMPTDEQIATLDADTQQRFCAVQQAAAENDAAKAKREAAEQSVKDAIAERDAAEKELQRVRPKVDPVAVAKAIIAANRAN